MTDMAELTGSSSRNPESAIVGSKPAHQPIPNEPLSTEVTGRNVRFVQAETKHEEAPDLFVTKSVLDRKLSEMRAEVQGLRELVQMLVDYVLPSEQEEPPVSK
jgi:hypothetical protein